MRRDESDRTPFGKCYRFVSKASGGNDKATHSLLRGHDAIQFSDGGDANLLSLPLLALNEVRVLAHVQLNIDTAIGAVSSPLTNSVALLPEGLGSKALEFTPRHSIQRVLRWITGNRTMKFLLTTRPEE